ncbi:MAG: hypothetical protein JWO33_1688 [Caulobacteraceae bacterium]|nr:hypothetical protein [Caulobacteraceae bacterium]
MIRIFHAPRTRSIRVVWLMEELGLPYEVQACTLRDLPAELVAHNPAATLPLMIDGDVVLAESVTMLEYVADTYGPTELAIERDDPRYWDYRQMLVFGEASVAALINPIVGTMFMAPEDERSNFTTNVIKGLIKKRLSVVEKRLAAQSFIMGEAFTIADISVGYGINLMLAVPSLGLGELISDPVRAYYERLAARPAFQRMIKVK